MSLSSFNPNSHPLPLLTRKSLRTLRRGPHPLNVPYHQSCKDLEHARLSNILCGQSDEDILPPPLPSYAHLPDLPFAGAMNLSPDTDVHMSLKIAAIFRRLKEAIDADPEIFRIYVSSLTPKEAQMLKFLGVDTLRSDLKADARELAFEVSDTFRTTLDDKIDLLSDKSNQFINNSMRAASVVIENTVQSFMSLLQATLTFTEIQLRKLTTVIAASVTCYLASWDPKIVLAQLTIIALQFDWLFKTPISTIVSTCADGFQAFIRFMTAMFLPHSIIGHGPDEISNPFADFSEAASFLSVLLTGNKSPSTGLSNRLKAIADLGRNMSAINSFRTLSMQCIDYVVDLVYEASGVDRKALKIEALLPDFKAFLQEYTYLSSTEAVRLISTDSVICERISQLWLKSFNFQTVASRPHFDPSLSSYLRLIHGSISTLHTRVANMGPLARNTRKTPFFSLFSGPAGTGKTYITMAISDYILSKYFSDVPPNLQRYCHSNATEYWDSYARQPIVHMDELFQKVDVAGCPNPDFNMIINLVNTIPFKLPVAVAEEKARAYFDSSDILGTTNVRYITAVSINEVPAITRRIHVDAIPIPTCLKSRQDVSDGVWRGHNILPHNIAVDCPNHGPDCYAFVIYDPAKSAQRREYINPPTSVYADPFALASRNFGPWVNMRACLWTFKQFMDYFISTRENHVKQSFSTSTFSDQVSKIMGHASVPSEAPLPLSAQDLLDDYAHLGCFFSENDAIDVSSFIVKYPYLFHQRLVDYATHHNASFNYQPGPVPPATPFPADLSPLDMIKFLDFMTMFNGGAFQSNSSESNCADSLKYDFMLLTYAPIAQMDAFEILDLKKTPESPSSKKKKSSSITSDELEFASCMESMGDPVHDELIRLLKTDLDVIVNLPPTAPSYFTRIGDAFKFGIETHWVTPFQYSELTRIKEDIIRSLDAPTTKLRDNLVSYGTQALKTFSDGAACIKETFVKHEAFFFLSALAIAGSAATIYFSMTSPTSAHIYIYDNKLKKNIWVSEEDYDHFKTYKRDDYSPSRIYDYTYGNSDATVSVPPDTEKNLQIDLYYKNVASISAWNGDVRLGGVQILFIKGKFGVTVRHFEYCLSRATHVTIDALTKDRSQKIPISEVFRHTLDDEKSDLMSISFSNKQLNSYPDITHHINSRDFFSMDLVSSCAMLTLSSTLRGHENIVRRLISADARYASIPLCYTSGENKICQMGHFSYRAEVSPGMCGAPLISTSNKFQKKLLGFHIAGDTSAFNKQGYALPLIKEDIDALLAHDLNPSSKRGHSDGGFIIPPIVTSVNSQSFFFPEHGKCFMGIGFVDNKLAAARSWNTLLVPSELHGALGTPTKRPAILKPTIINGSLHDPLLSSLKKSTFYTPPLNEVYILNAVNALKQIHAPRNTDVLRRVLTEEEGIWGVPEFEGFDAMSLDKGSGFGHGGKPKRAFLDPKNPRRFIPSVMDRVAAIITESSEGFRPFEIFTSFLKDEKLDNAKVDIGKTRPVYMSTIEFLLAIRMYFLSFTVMVMNRRIENDICVGIDPTSSDWSALLRHLTAKGDKAFAGDFKDFDFNQNSQIVYPIVDIVNNWYDDGPVNARIRRMLWACIANPIILCGNKLYMLDHTIPSGHGMTAVGNSLYSDISFRYAWQDLFRDSPSMATMASHDRHVSSAYYGDDNIKNISDHAIGRFNQNSVVPVFKDMGMIYTNENKIEMDVPDFKDISLASFLKRSFFLHPDIKKYVGALELRSIDESINYVNNGPYAAGALLQSLYACCLEWGLHGKDVYEKRIALIHKAIRARDLILPFTIPTYDEVMHITYNKVIAHMMVNMSHEKGQEEQWRSSKDYNKKFVTGGTAITRFTADSGIANAVKPKVSKLPEGTTLCTRELAATLSNWVKIASIPWNIGTLPKDELWSASLPDIITSVPMIQRKITDHLYMRQTIRLRLIPMAEPTAVGKAWLFFSPLAEYRGNRVHNNNLSCMTGYFGIEIDLGSPAAIVMDIPYCNINPYHDLKNGLGSLGKIFMVVINPYNSVVLTNKATIEVYATLIDVELCVPTPNTIIAHSDSEEQIKSKLGMVSGVLQGISTATSYLSPVPAIGSIASKISWITGIGSNVASMMGFCKPTDQKSVMTMTMLPGARYTNANGLDNSVVLGTIPDNQIEPSFKIFATDTDEMSITHICSKMAYISTSPWVQADLTNTVLAVFPVTPAIGGQDSAYPGGYFNTTPLGFVASMAKYWKGSLSFKVSVAKNDGYSGTLALVYLPGYTTAQVLSTTNFDACYKVILDLKENSEGSIDIKYQSNKPWLEVYFTNPASFYLQTPNTAQGSFAIIVDSPLTLQNNVPPTIYFNVWMCAGPDFAIACADFAGYDIVAPTPSFLSSSSTPVPQNKMEKSFISNRNKIIAHAGNEDQAEPGTSNTEQTQKPDSITLNPEAAIHMTFGERSCIGEAITNLRPLTRRYGYLVSTAIDGFAVDPTYFGDVSVPPILPRDSQVPINYISYLYALYAGSRRYKVFLDNSAISTPQINKPTYWSAYLNWEGNNPFRIVSGYGAFLSGMFSSQASISSTSVIEVQIPYYQNHVVSLISNIKYPTLDYHPVVYFDVGSESNPSMYPGCTKHIYTAAADDFSFGYLIGTPQIFNSGE